MNKFSTFHFVILTLVLFAVSGLYSQDIRINSGAGEYTANNGDLFEADVAYTPGNYGYIGGEPKNWESGINGTDDDPLYQDMRFDEGTFSYQFDNLENGTYDVTMHFMEPSFNGAGGRVFDIAIQGVLTYNNFDIWEEIGNTYTALIVTTDAEVTNGTLTIDFASVASNALICAIEVSAGAGSGIYEDVTSATGLDLEHVLDTGLCGPPLSVGSAWADYDNDGDLDFYLTSHGSANRLYRNSGEYDENGLPEFSDVAGSFGLQLGSINSVGANFVDYDNDGDQDLYVTNVTGNMLFQNQLIESGSVDFLDVTELAGVADYGRGITSAWADFNQDGYLDFYVAKHAHCMGEIWEHEDPLFMNNGDGTFTDVSDWLCQDDGSCPQDEGLGFSPGWVDYDNDGDVDLYLVNDILDGSWHENVLWRNDGSDGAGGWIFTEVSQESGAGIALNGMGLGIADYNNDGWMDLAFSNVGNNVLLRNNGDGTFDDVAPQAGTERTLTPGGNQSITWGTVFFDYNNDGWQDLFIGAGNIGTTEPDQPNAFFGNNGDGTFEDLSAAVNLDHIAKTRHAARVDFNEDGFVDLFIGAFGEPGVLYKNNSVAYGNTNRWLTVTLEGTVSNRDALGSRVYVTDSFGATQMQDLNSGPTHGGGDAKATYFGIGTANSGTVSVRWPTGEWEHFGTFVANQVVHLVEGSTTAADYVDATTATGIDLSHDLLDFCPDPPIGSGSAWADFDNDGDVDLYVTNQEGANRLYRNDGDSDADGLPEFTDVAVELNVDNSDIPSHSANFVDYDNDGDQDLYVTNYNMNTLFLNTLNETGVLGFIDVTEIAGVVDDGRGITSAWGDFNQDGWLDFYVAKHFLCMPEEPVNHDPLFMNNGDGTFTNVNEWLCGDNCPHEEALGFSPGWFDMDNDGDLDLYLANDFLGGWYGNVLWRNDGSDGAGGWIFTDVSAESNTDYQVSAMGLGIGDYDNDTYMDLAFSNGGPNYLLRNEGNGTFSNQSQTAGITRDEVPGGGTSITWGTAFFDYDNDGWLDLLFVAGALGGNINAQPNAMFRNNHDGTFTDISTTSGLDDEGRARDASMADVNGDGYVDILVGNYGQPGHLYVNNNPALGNTNNWLAVTVEGIVSNRDGIGSRITVETADGLVQTREITSGPTHGGGDQRVAFFGLGDNSSADVTVRWPDGATETMYADVAANQYVHYMETDPGNIGDNDNVPFKFELGQNYPNPFNPSTTIEYSLQRDIEVSIKIFNVLGQEVATLLNAKEVAGKHQVIWDGRNNDGQQVATGIYIYRMKAGDFVESRKMLLTK